MNDSLQFEVDVTKADLVLLSNNGTVVKYTFKASISTLLATEAVLRSRLIPIVFKNFQVLAQLPLLIELDYKDLNLGKFAAVRLSLCLYFAQFRFAIIQYQKSAKVLGDVLVYLDEVERAYQIV